MKITLEINEIDYGSLVTYLLPLVKDKLSEKDVGGSTILSKIVELLLVFVKGMIAVLPKETKDEIAVMLINKNKDKIIETIMQYSEEKDISFRIDTLEIE